MLYFIYNIPQHYVDAGVNFIDATLISPEVTIFVVWKA